MAYERYPRRGYGQNDERGERGWQDYGRDDRDDRYSSARDYAAAGYGYGSPGGEGRDRNRFQDREDNDTRGQRGGYYGGNDSYYSGSQSDERGGLMRDRGNQGRGGYQSPYRGSYASDGHRFTETDRGRSQNYGGGQGGDDDRGFMSRAGDEVRSWFGDEEAERRRERDRMQDERYGQSGESGGGSWQSRNASTRSGSAAGDDHYTSWRRQRIAELDRDYDEYRRENEQKFHNEFSSFRTERQTQRECLNRVTEHMEVLGSDGEHVGTVDKVRGDRILLTKSDADAGGRHHSIPSRWIDSVDSQVRLRKTADEAKRHWRDEENNMAMFGDDPQRGDQDRDDRLGRSHNLNRSFSGTY